MAVKTKPLEPAVITTTKVADWEPPPPEKRPLFPYRPPRDPGLIYERTFTRKTKA